MSTTEDTTASTAELDEQGMGLAADEPTQPTMRVLPPTPDEEALRADGVTRITITIKHGVVQPFSIEGKRLTFQALMTALRACMMSLGQLAWERAKDREI